MCFNINYGLTLAQLYFVGFFSTKVNLRNRSTTFTLGNRDSMITSDLESPIIVVPHAQKSEKKVRILKCVQHSLTDVHVHRQIFV